MGLFDKDIAHARQSLEKVSREAIDRAGDQLDSIVTRGIEQAGAELRQAITHAGRELDDKLSKTVQELHSQRELAKSDLQALVDYSSTRLGASVDERIATVQEVLEQTSTRIDNLVRSSIDQANTGFQQMIRDAGQELDLRLENISREIHNHRQLTREDIKEVVDYAAVRLGSAIDERIQTTRTEMTTLVKEKIEVLKQEIDTFFIRRQEDLARERRRLVVNVLIAVTATILMAAFSLLYHRFTQGRIDLFDFFRVLFISLTVGYSIFLAVRLVMRYLKMAEHRKDLVFFAMRYVGVLHPESVLSYVVLLFITLIVLGVLLFPYTLVQLIGNDSLSQWMEKLRRQ